MMRLSHRAPWLLLGAAAVLAAGSPAAAQDADSLRSRYLIELPPNIQVLSTVGRVSPGSTSGSPVGFGANWGDGFVGISYQDRVRFIDENDGALVAGFGLGNARDLVGGEVAITSFSTIRSEPWEVVALSLKAHKILPGNFGVAVGWESAVFLSQSEGDGGSSLYGAVTKVWPQSWWQPFTTLTATAGIGNGRFRSEEDVLQDNETVNPFGSVALQVWEPASFIADWTGQDLTLAVSLVPFESLPLVITPAVTDVTESAGDGARFILSAGMGFDFANVPRWFP